MTPFEQTTINLPILELAYVHREFYNDPDAPGAYHFKVSYLVDLGGTETVLDMFPCTTDDLMKCPMIDIDTEVSSYEQQGNRNVFLYQSTIRELIQIDAERVRNDPTMPMGPNGNERID